MYIYAKCHVHCLAQYYVRNRQSIQHHVRRFDSKEPECVLCVLLALLAHTVVSSKFQANFRRWFGWFIRLSQPEDKFFIVFSVFRTDGHS